ncbi:MAG TPA: hypothetical protein VFR70_04610, partial [Flavobacterium sp.]|nr:hypothetical protein [Flavobacterium sp.]
MNTEIKNTLFRFVTMRAPELSDENQKDKRFVFRKQKTHDSLFDEAVKSKSPAATNWQALQSAAAAFVPLTEAALKTTIHPDYLDFATWIARNKHSFSTQELLEKLRLLKNSSTTAKLVPETLTLLWNNLFYQVATQKDFYIKETLMQLLIANHIYENIDLVEKEYEKAARKLKNPVYETQLIKNVVNAKVVLPKELFGEKTAAVSGASRTSIENIKTAAGQPIVSVPSEEMKQFVAASEAKINLDRYSKLKAELQKIEKSYRREYQESYDKAAEEHQARIEPIMEEYNRQMEQNRVTWCANRNLIQFGANDPCNQPPAVPKPKLPKFEFKFRHELDLDYLQPQLTQDSFHALLDVLGIGPEA